MRNCAEVWGVMAIVGVTVLTGWGLVSSRALADDTVSTAASVTVSSSCQLDSTEGTAHEAEVVASTYRADIGETTITATCNDVNGYAIYAVGYTNNELGRNDMLGSTTGRTIATGTATSGDTSNWAMKLTPVTSTATPTIVTGYDAYHAIPSEYTKVSSYANSTMESASGSQMKTTYAAFVAGTQVPDVYNGKVKYTLIHPSDSANRPCVGKYTISYNANGGSGNMDSQSACVDTSITLLPNGFTPPTPVAENQFVLWNTEADGSGYTYYVGQSVTNLASVGETITLYAQWAPKYMQDLTRSTCGVVANGQPLTVYDRRDGNDYTVRYIAGACWMTQNLRITGTIYSNLSNFNTYDNVNVCEADLTAGNSLDQPRCHNSGNTSNGVWYNYAATSAKTIRSSSSVGATEDICPSEWHIPNHDTSGPAGSISSITSYSEIFSPITGGLYNGGTIDNSTYGYWWTSSGGGSGYRIVLTYRGGLGANGQSYPGSRGVYIRCVR